MDWVEYIQLLLRLMCHQKKERCFHLGNSFSVFCARCTGNNFGFFATLIWLFFLYGFSTVSLSWVPAMVTLLPVAIDGGTQTLGWRQSNNAIRFFTGYLMGTGSAMIYFYAFSLAFFSGPAAVFLPSLPAFFSMLLAPLFYGIILFWKKSNQFKTFLNGTSIAMFFLLFLLALLAAAALSIRFVLAIL